MPDDTAEGVKDRLARRFEGEDAEKSSAEDQPVSDPADGTNTSNAGSEAAAGRERSQNAKKAKNVKKEWNALSVYLPDDLAADLSRSYKKLDWQLEESEGVSIKKTRHFYPLVVELGLERLERMESNEIEERIDRVDE